MTWRADEGNTYFFIDRFIEVLREIDYRSKGDEKHYDVGNYFKTKELAEKMADKLRGLLDEVG